MPISASKLAHFSGTTREFIDRFAEGPLKDFSRSRACRSCDDLVTIIKAIAGSVPSATASSPKWVPRKPLLVLGWADRSGKIQTSTARIEFLPRIGLCRFDSDIHLLADRETLDVYEADHPGGVSAMGEWVFWDSLRSYLKTPLVAAGLCGWRIAAFLASVEAALQQAPGDDGSGAPAIGGPDGPLPSSGANASEDDDDDTAGEAETTACGWPPTATEQSTDAQRLAGVLSLDGQGKPQIALLAPEKARELTTGTILAVVQGPDACTLRGVMEVLLDVEKAHRAGDSPPDAKPTAISGGHAYFVYAYWRNLKPSWQNLFYVGKGKGKRDQSHICEVLRDRGAANTPKKRTIEAALRELHPQCSRIRTLTDFQKALAAHNSTGSGSDRLYQRVFTGLTELQAFMVEYLLVQAIGVYDISNETGGNAAYGDYSALAMPKVARCGQLHALHTWSATIGEFLKLGAVSYRMQGELDLLPIYGLADALESWLAHGPLAGLLEPELDRPVRVAHGQNATINYRLCRADPPFRIELLASRKDAGLRINLRPVGNATNFREHLTNRGLHVTGATYCKPFAPEGHGKRDAFFPARPGPAGYERVQVTGPLPWLARCPHNKTNVNIEEALLAVVRCLS